MYGSLCDNDLLPTGVVTVSDPSETETSDGKTTTFPFRTDISQCYNDDDAEFRTWPKMQPSTSYFVVFAVAGATGNLNPALEGTIASTL